MLATPELIKEAALPYRLSEVLPRWLREVPLYKRMGLVRQSGGEAVSLADLRCLPLIAKEDIRRDFPRNFLRAGVDLDTLLDQDVVELEHTSGTSEARTPLLLGRGWWAEQEERALRLNPFVAGVLDEFPEARRVTINSPVCSGDICYSGVPSRADRVVGNALFVSLSRYPFLGGKTSWRAWRRKRSNGRRSSSTWTRCMARCSRFTANGGAFACRRCGSFWAATSL